MRTKKKEPRHLAERSPEYITSKYQYQTSVVTKEGNKTVVRPKTTEYTFRTQRKVPKTGLMLVGWGGNNGSTTTAGVLANKLGLSWETKTGTSKANYFGSLTQASTVRIGSHGPNHQDVFVPFNSLLPMVSPNDLVLGGWDISSMNLADAMKRSKVRVQRFAPDPPGRGMRARARARVCLARFRPRPSLVLQSRVSQSAEPSQQAAGLWSPSVFPAKHACRCWRLRCRSSCGRS